MLALVSPPVHRRLRVDHDAGLERLDARAAGGYRNRAAADLRHVRHPAGVQPEVLPLRLSADGKRLGAISPSVEEAAESLGAGPWRRFFKVTLPLVFPAVSSGALLAFVLSIADFGTPSIVGGKVRAARRPPRSILFTAEMGGNPGLASATSVVLIAVSMAVVVLQRWAVRRRDIAGSLIRRPSPQRLRPVASAAAHFVCYAIVLAGSLPSLVVIYTSFRKTSGPVFHPGFSLDSYAKNPGRGAARHRQQLHVFDRRGSADRDPGHVDRLHPRPARDAGGRRARQHAAGSLHRAGRGDGTGRSWSRSTCRRCKSPAPRRSSS